jgi:peptide/nickel transport system substrate-binding protein
MIISAFLLIFLTACGGQSSPDHLNKTNSKKTINVGIAAVPANFDPLEHTDDAVLDLFFQPLVQYDSSGKNFIPFLAKKITTTDNQAFKVELNKKAKWTDGKPVTADDVLYTVGAITNKKVAAVQTSKFYIFKGTDSAGFSTSNNGKVSGIKKIDNQTVEFTTKWPVEISIIKSIFTVLRPIPAHILKEVPIKKLFTNKLFQNPTVTDGPFKVNQIQKDQFIRFTANHNYYKGTPKINQLNVKILTESNIVAQLQNGEIDLNASSVSSEDYNRLKSLKNVKSFISDDQNIARILFINTKKIKDAKVRRAINYAINRETIVKNYLKGAGEIAQGPYLTNNVYYNDKYAPSYNPDKAKKLVKEANWDSKRTLQFVADTGNSGFVKVIQMIADDLKNIGIKVKINQYDHVTALAKARKGDYDLYNVGYGLSPSEPDVSFLIKSTGSFDITQYHNKEVDQLLDKGLKKTSFEDRKKIYDQLQQKFAKDIPDPFLYGEKPIFAVNKRVKVGNISAFGLFNNAYLWEVK